MKDSLSAKLPATAPGSSSAILRNRMKKPILLLDIDGVIAPWPSKLGFDQDTHWYDEANGIHMRRDLPDLIKKLATIVELQWGTAWEREANSRVLQHLGLTNPLPFIEFHDYEDLGDTIAELVEKEDGHYHVIHGAGGNNTWKLPWIERFCRANPGRAIVWIDDEIEQDAQDFAASREEPTLFVKTNGLVGLDETHIEEIEKWLKETSPDSE